MPANVTAASVVCAPFSFYFNLIQISIFYNFVDIFVKYEYYH